jgi:hypothetical protein
VKALFYTLVSKSPLQQDIEDKLLYLIQLWYDTFMMHEDEFKEIIALYKQLRKEGVVFPPRDSTAKFMIQFKGTTSPIFETIEENKVYEEPTKQFKMTGTKVGTKDFISASYGNPTGGMGSTSSSSSKRPAYLGQNYEAQHNAQERHIEEEVENCTNMDAEEVSKADEVTVIRESCILLDDIMTHAQHLNDLRGEIAMEVIENHEVSLKKLKKLFADKTQVMTEDQRSVGRLL